MLKKNLYSESSWDGPNLDRPLASKYDFWKKTNKPYCYPCLCIVSDHAKMFQKSLLSRI